MSRLLVAGWKLSTIDVKGKVTFTLWVCGCNLKCPFCHNWRLADADPTVCHVEDIERIVSEAERSRFLIDYVHVTGGEPLVQYRSLRELFKRLKERGVAVSLNSNLTLYEELCHMIDYVDHVATDLKIPQLMYGVEDYAKYFENFLKSIELISKKGILLEIRVPVIRVPPEIYLDVFNKVKRHLKNGKYYLVFNQIRGRPFTDPRNPSWCERYCIKSIDEFKTFVEKLQNILQ